MKIKVLSLSILIFSISLFGSYLGRSHTFFIHGLLFFIATLILKKNTQKNIHLFWILGPTLLLHLITSIHAAIVGTAFAILFPVISIFSILFALLIYNSRYKTTLALTYMLFLIPLAYLGYPNWVNYVYDYENPINTEFPKDLILKDHSGKVYDLSKDRGTVIVLDLWSSSCGVCIEEFPNYEKQKNKYQNDPNVKFYSINLGLKRDSTINVSKYVKDYTFQTLYADVNSWKLLENRSVPKLLILDKNFSIVYKGSMYAEWYHFYNNFNSIINKLKNEDV